MPKDNYGHCPQTQRALRMLIGPDSPRIDREKFIEAMPGPTPVNLTDLIDLIIQIILALLENKDKEDKPKPPQPDDVFSELRRVAYDTAIETLGRDTLLRDLPKLIPAIHLTAEMIPVPGFNSQRQAREHMRISNNSALGKSARNWRLWNDAIRTELDNLAFDEHLEGLIDYKYAWLAISQALTTVQSLARTDRL